MQKRIRRKKMISKKGTARHAGTVRWRQTVHREAKNWLKILPGVLLAALAYRLWLIPNRVPAGGFTGLGQLLNVLTGLPVGAVVFCLNTPLFFVCRREFGWAFLLRSLGATVLFSLTVDLLPVGGVTDDVLLSAIFGGALAGAGLGLVLGGNASTGGTDMFAAWLNHRFPSISTGRALLFTDALVVALSAFLFDAATAMYALIAVYMVNMTLEATLEGPQSARLFLVVSEKSGAAAQAVMQNLGRGVTALPSRGVYSGKTGETLLCVVGRTESARFRAAVFAVDKKAFVVAINAHEVLGEGFLNPS